ncbi:MULTISPECIES: SNF2-related protein [Ferrimicrobium]|uniref:SNF2-related protein n=1 Tax=Ferrimicrobium TaxID=121038 RepID=UPI0023F4912A|nr:MULTISPECIES: SNF2-related protein [Ferrimicrobium]
MSQSVYLGSNRPFPPVFATNNPDSNETVAEEIRRLIEGSLEELRQSPSASIASAYVNVGGFDLLADQLEALPAVRLLLGAEPEVGMGTPLVADYLFEPTWLSGVLTNHDRWLAAERDLTAFSLQNDRSARRLVAWLRSRNEDGSEKVEVRRYTRGFLHGKAFIVDHPTHPAVLAGSSNLTYAGLMTNRELNLGYPNGEHTHLVREWFDDLWNEAEPFDLAGIYATRWEEHSPYLIFMRMLHLLYGDQEPDRALEAGLGLTSFQRDGVARALRILETHGGVLICDEVGLGKTYVAGEIIRRATEMDRQRVLVLCPAAVRETVWEKFLDSNGFSRRARVYSYDTLRNRLLDQQTAEDFRRELDDYALVVIDEAHNLRNAAAQRSRVVTDLLGGKFPKKTVLLTATPVNNSLMDLWTLVSYFVKNDGALAAIGIPSIRGYIASAQTIDPESLSPQHLFDLMDQVAVRRTRRFVKRNYRGDTFRSPTGAMTPISFPTPRVKRLDYGVAQLGTELLTQVLDALMIKDDDELVVTFEKRRVRDNRLVLARYTASAYLRTGEIEKFQVHNSGLLRSALLKRLESSPNALASTLETMIGSHNAFLSALDRGYVLAGDALSEWISSASDDLDTVLASLDDAKGGTQIQGASLFHVTELREDVVGDRDLLVELQAIAQRVARDYDHKATRLVEELREIAREAETVDRSGLDASDRRKSVIFSTYTDTIIDLAEKVTRAVELAPASDPLSTFRGRICAPIYGAKGGTDQEARARDIMRFAPRTAGSLRDDGTPISEDRYDLLFTTDVLSEGVNLQQAGRMINYDLPWNPMRLVQRAGRIDRIGSLHDHIVIGCFFPETRLDELLGLEATLMRKLAYADAAVGTGEVLPGQGSKTEVVLADTAEQIRALREERPELFEGEGDLGAISGEEYRRRLSQATSDNERFRNRLLKLPFGSGSGFRSDRIDRNGYVFCIKMGEQEKPWLRFVPVDANWDPLPTDSDNTEPGFEISDDTLTALSYADPGDEHTSRWLPSEVYEKVFPAWAIAASHAYRAWSYLTNPNNLRPEIERAFRDGAEYVLAHGNFLGSDTQNTLAERLSGRWNAEVKRALRQVLDDEQTTSREKVERLASIADVYGLTTTKAAEPLPLIHPDEVRLVAWMAIARNPPGD